MSEPEIRLWPFRSLDPIPNPLPDDPDELNKCLAPVWIKSTKADEPDPKPQGLMQLVVAARALCDDYPREELLGEIADTKPRNKHQDERRYPVKARRHLVDVTMAEAECSRLEKLQRAPAREWGEVLHLLYNNRFPKVWSGEDRPNLNLPLWAPAESVLGVLNEWRPELEKHARAGGNFAARATRVATTAAAAFLECLTGDGEIEAASFFIERFIPPKDEDLQFIEADSCEDINDAVERIRHVRHILEGRYRGKPRRALYVAIDGGGTRSTIVVHPPLQPQRRLEVGIPLTGSGSRSELAQRIDDIASEIARSTSDLPDRDALRTVIAVGAPAGSPGEMQSIKPLFKRAFERHLKKFDLVVMNDADIVLTAERLGVEQRSPETARPVICLIAGTGSVLVAQRVDGSYLRLDGEEWVASDCFAGTELARRALQVTLTHCQLTAADADPRLWDILKLDPPGTPGHQDRQTLLDELVEHFGYADIAQTVHALAVDFNKADLASATTLISELADTGNVAAQELVGEVARNASDYVTAAQCWADADSNNPILFLIGSLAGNAGSGSKSSSSTSAATRTLSPITRTRAAGSAGMCRASRSSGPRPTQQRWPCASRGAGQQPRKRPRKPSGPAPSSRRAVALIAAAATDHKEHEPAVNGLAARAGNRGTKEDQRGRTASDSVLHAALHGFRPGLSMHPPTNRPQNLFPALQE